MSKHEIIFWLIYYTVSVAVWGGILPYIYQRFVWVDKSSVRRSSVGWIFWPFTTYEQSPMTVWLHEVCTPVWVAVESECREELSKIHGEVPPDWKRTHGKCPLHDSPVYARYELQMPSRVGYALIGASVAPMALLISHLILLFIGIGKIMEMICRPLFGKLPLRR